MEKSMQAVAMAQNSQSLIQFGKDEVELIRQTKTPGASDAQFNLFLYDAQSRGLNPLRNEIYWVSRQKKSKDKFGNWSSETVATHQVGIDGFRKIAQSSGEYEGQTPVEFGDVINYLGVKVPEWAEVGVYRKGFREALKARAYFSEYAQMYNDKLGTMWEKMPRTMLAKCAEALALRKSFPAELGGLYTNDEMSQAENTKVEIKEVKVDPAEIEKARKTIKKAKEEVVATPETIAEFESLFAEVAKLYNWSTEKRLETRGNLVGDEVAKVEEAQLVKINDQLKTRVQLEKKAVEAAEIFDSVTEPTNE